MTKYFLLDSDLVLRIERDITLCYTITNGSIWKSQNECAINDLFLEGTLTLV